MGRSGKDARVTETSLEKRHAGWLDAPAVALGVLERALHLFAEHFRERRARYGAGARFGDVGSAVAAAEDAQQRLLHPVRFQRQPEGVAQHHSDAENRANKIW